MRKLGPGFLVAAAFIGPGTVTTATIAGAHFGYSLLWALVFSIAATLILQSMAARLGVVTGLGLSENLRSNLPSGIPRVLMMILVILGIGVGNAAYEAGNLTGAAIGMHNIFGGDTHLWAGALGIIALVLMLVGNLPFLTMILISLVFLMSLVFLVTLFVASPDWSAIATNILLPSLPEASVLTAIALVGTTVVPYNLFLHASLAAHFCTNDDAPKRLKAISKDSAIAITVGGLITLAVISTSAATFFASGLSPTIENIAQQLTPLLGDFAPLFFALGLFSAGLTSAITAPLAASFAISGVMGWSTKPNNPRFKAVWLIILSMGTALCFLQIKPLEIIVLAQVANGILLPVLAGFLLWVVNSSVIMGAHINNWWQNIAGAVVILLVLALSTLKLASML
ncbi:MAG: Nramp family divalent metal transporter [Aestuariibacter sp.]